MTLQEFIVAPVAKYAVVSALAYYNFPVATNLAQGPRIFNTNITAYAILSLRDEEIPMLVAYVKTIGFDIEWEFTEGSNKVTLLTHPQVLELLNIWEPEE